MYRQHTPQDSGYASTAKPEHAIGDNYQQRASRSLDGQSGTVLVLQVAPPVLRTASHSVARTRLHMAEQYTEPPHRRKEVHGRVDDDRRALPTTHHRTPSDEQHTAQAVHHRARRKARRRARRRAQVTARCRAEDMARHMGLARRRRPAPEIRHGTRSGQEQPRKTAPPRWATRRAQTEAERPRRRQEIEPRRAEQTP